MDYSNDNSRATERGLTILFFVLDELLSDDAAVMKEYSHSTNYQRRKGFFFKAMAQVPYQTLTHDRRSTVSDRHAFRHCSI